MNKQLSLLLSTLIVFQAFSGGSPMDLKNYGSGQSSPWKERVLIMLGTGAATGVSAWGLTKFYYTVFADERVKAAVAAEAKAEAEFTENEKRGIQVDGLITQAQQEREALRLQRDATAKTSAEYTQALTDLGKMAQGDSVPASIAGTLFGLNRKIDGMGVALGTQAGLQQLVVAAQPSADGNVDAKFLDRLGNEKFQEIVTNERERRKTQEGRTVAASEYARILHAVAQSGFLAFRPLQNKVLKEARQDAKKATPGQRVEVDYTGWLDQDGQPGDKFDSSVDRGQHFEFNAGIGQVIRGWDETLLDMKVGEKRRVYIPAHLGYGERGAGAVIPPNADLIFDIELYAVK